ncbi:ATP-binding cassette domain-containing protein, partial [bacterium]|nr:ATP-binding cassette domain-containing protein [bacterium]
PIPPRLTGALVLTAVSLEEDGGGKTLEQVSCAIPLDRKTVIVGAGGGKSDLAQVVARLRTPSSGQIRLGERDFIQAPESLIGRRVAYVGATSHRRRRIDEALRSGNTALDFTADWIDYAAAGCDGAETLNRRLIAVLRAVDLDGDLYAMGLKRTIDPERRPDVAARALAARESVAQRLKEPGLTRLVERFDPERFNHNA